MFTKIPWRNILRDRNLQDDSKRFGSRKNCQKNMQSYPSDKYTQFGNTFDINDKLETARRRREAVRTCTCSNCSVLPTNVLCDICLSPLQGSKIESCAVCTALVCQKCASQITKCAFCKTSKPLEKNRAVESLINKLELPCKNMRYGCKVSVFGETRLSHEKVCSFGVEKCPVDLDCHWQGPIISIQSHFRIAHGLSVTNDYTIGINIDQFQRTAVAKNGKQYTVCLKCYDQLFFFKIILYNEQLKIYFCRVGYLCPVTLYDTQQILKIRIIIVSEGGIRECDHYDIENTNCQNLISVKVACNNFYKKKPTSEDRDRVQVIICVKKDYRSSTKIQICPYKLF